VVKKLAEHLDGDPGVGVPLGGGYLYLILKNAW
jgi:hypothetical protein